jgi:DNA-binding LacI/PurR family transcriptional regulator
MGDVAALAGVSSMTVSRALNAPHAVAPATRAKVMAAAESLGYRPNPAARSLATGRSGTLSVLALDATLHGPAATLAGIEVAARARGFSISVTSATSREPRSVHDSVERLRDQAAEGLLIIAPHVRVVRDLDSLFGELPVVAVGAGARDDVPSVTVGHRSGAGRATRHLLALGHPTVWHLAGPSDWIDAHQRIEGWRDALTDSGRAVPPLVTGDWTARSGYEAGCQLAADPDVTAIFAAGDAMALGLLRALHEHGRNVPDDVSVVGFDDVPEAAHFWPPLTTVRQDFFGLGGRAVGLLIERLASRGAPPTHQVLEPELIVRDSTGGHVTRPSVRRSAQRALHRNDSDQI